MLGWAGMGGEVWGWAGMGGDGEFTQFIVIIYKGLYGTRHLYDII